MLIQTLSWCGLELCFVNYFELSWFLILIQMLSWWYDNNTGLHWIGNDLWPLYLVYSFSMLTLQSWIAWCYYVQLKNKFSGILITVRSLLIISSNGLCTRPNHLNYMMLLGSVKNQILRNINFCEIPYNNNFLQWSLHVSKPL